MDRDIEIISAEKWLIKLDKSIYDKEAVLKTGFIFQDHFDVKVSSISDKIFGVLISKKEVDVDVNDIAKRFFNELIDQQIRLDNEKMFGDLRKEIVKQAFRPVHFNKIKNGMEEKGDEK